MLLLPLAHAAVPLQLPPGEAAAAWSSALRMAGFEPGQAGGAPSVALEAAGSEWRMVVVDVAGGRHAVTVAIPVTPREREDLAWVAQSLVEPVVPGFGRPGARPLDDAPLVAPVVAPRRTRPAPRSSPVGEGGMGPGASQPIPPPVELSVVVEPAPEPIPDAPVPPPAGVVEESVAMPAITSPARASATIPATAPPVRAVGAIHGAVRLREGLAPSPIVGLSAGVEGSGWRLGGEFSELLPAAIEADGRAEAEVAGERAVARIALGPTWTVAPVGGLGAGAVHHRFLQADEERAAAWVPVLLGEVGVRVRAGDAVDLEVGATAGWDLRALHLSVDGTPVGGWSAWSIEPTLQLVLRPGW